MKIFFASLQNIAGIKLKILDQFTYFCRSSDSIFHSEYEENEAMRHTRLIYTLIFN